MCGNLRRFREKFKTNRLDQKFTTKKSCLFRGNYSGSLQISKNASGGVAKSLSFIPYFSVLLNFENFKIFYCFLASWFWPHLFRKSFSDGFLHNFLANLQGVLILCNVYDKNFQKKIWTDFELKSKKSLSENTYPRDDSNFRPSSCQTVPLTIRPPMPPSKTPIFGVSFP